jgi:hypothetical protein
MNKELIQKFLNKACWDEQAQHELEDWLNVEKFAELIVRECAGRMDHILRERQAGGGTMGDDIREHFGVEE